VLQHGLEVECQLLDTMGKYPVCGEQEKEKIIIEIGDLA
jgi:hypothetical protein